MNTDNLKATIAILKRADPERFRMAAFQSNLKVPYAEFQLAETEEELHTCGNSACIAGYVGVSPEWRAAGGKLSGGLPVLGENMDSVSSMAQFWGMTYDEAVAIVYGKTYAWEHFVVRYSLNDMPSEWHEMTREQAINLFEQLLEHA